MDNTTTDLTFEGYLSACQANYFAHPEWRWGQTLFNVLHTVRPDLSERVRGTLFDPFYSMGNGPKVGKFFTFVAENW